MKLGTAESVLLFVLRSVKKPGINTTIIHVFLQKYIHARWLEGLISFKY